MKTSQLLTALIFVISFAFISNKLKAQVDYEFWFVAPEVTSGHADRPIRFVLTSFGQASQAVISMPSNPGFAPITVNINANATQFVNLTPFIDDIETKPPAQVLNSGLLIRSDNPITAYYEVNPDNNCDIFTLKGQNALDKEFYIPQQNYFNNQPSRNPDAYAWFIIVASENNTTINVDLTQDAFGHLAANNPQLVNLNKGQTYAFRAPTNVQNGTSKFAGTKVTSDKPIAITLSDDSNYGWTNLNSGGYDLIGDQIVGTSQIGMDYVVVKGPGLQEEKIFIFATEDNTEIYLNDTSASAIPVVTLNEQQSFTYGNEPNGATFIHATKPIYVFHVSGYPKNGSNSDSEIGGALVPPLGCSGSSEVAFSRSAANNFSLILLIDSAGIDNFTATSDGVPVTIAAADFDTVPGTNGKYFFYNKAFDGAGNSFIENKQSIISNSKAVFHCGMFNGNDPGLRYGYFSGFTLVQLGRDRPFCKEDTVTLDAGILTEYNWFKKQSGNFIKVDSSRYLQVADSGTYVVTDNSIQQCLITDTVALAYHVTTNPNLSPDTSICEKLEFQFTAETVPGFKYLWSNGDTTNPVTLLAPDTFRIDTISVIITDTNGCRSYDTTYTAFDTVKTPSLFGVNASGQYPAICVQDDTIWLKGSSPSTNYLAYFSGPGIIEADSTDSIAVFDPGIAQAGNHNIIYTYIDTSTVGQCSTSDTAIMPVIPIVVTTPDTAVCSNSGQIKIYGLPVASGSETGNWVYTTAQFDTTGFYNSDSAIYTPTAAGAPYTDTLIYEFTTGSGCVNRDTAFIQVFLFPPVDTLIKTYCADAVLDTTKTFDLTSFDDSLNFGLALEIRYFSNKNFGVADSINDPTNFIASNNDTVFYKAVAGGGCISTDGFLVFNINPLPNPYLGNDTSICAGEEVYLKNTPKTGFDFLWFNSTTPDSVSVNSAGDYSLSKTNQTTGCFASDTITIAIDTLPNIELGSNLRICADSSVSFIAGSTNADFTFNWSNGAGDNRLITGVNTAGDYWAEKIIDATQCKSSDTVSLTVDTLPTLIFSDSTRCSFDSLLIAPFNASGYSFNWSTGSSDSSIYGFPGNSYSLRVTNIFGCRSLIDTTNILQDTTPPIANCYHDTTVWLDNSGQFTIDSLFVDSGSFDNCGSIFLSIDKSTFSCADVGANQTITLTATDIDGNSSTCQTNIIVIDTIRPNALCKDTIVYLDSLGIVSILDTGQFVTIFSEDFNADADGTYVLQPISNWNVTFGSIDLSPFVAGIPGKEVDLAGNSKGTIETIQSFNLFPGDYTISFQHISNTGSGPVNDTIQVNIGTVFSQTFISDGTLKSESQNFTVSNTESSTIEIIQTGNNDPSGSFLGNIKLFGKLIPTLGINNISTDNCNISVISSTDTIFDCNLLDTNFVTLTITDVSGNSSTCISQVVVVDTIKPTIIAKNDTIWLDSSGVVGFNINNFNQGSFDNCTITSIGTTTNSLNCADTGFNDVTIFAVDQSGNSDSLVVQLLVLDSIKPTPLCLDSFVVNLNSVGSFVIDTSIINQNSFDNCGIASWVLSDTSFNCVDIGFDTIQMTITDFSGNVNSCFTIIQTIDTTKPVLTCVSDTIVYLDSLGQITIDSSFVDLGSFDNCKLNGWTLSDSSFDCSSLDTNVVTYQITDASGNISQCNASIIVVDSIKPTIVAKNDTIWLDSSGVVGFNINNFNQGSFDNCTINSIGTTTNSLNCIDTGFNNVTVFAVDQSGNSDSLIVQLLVLDSIKPTITCSNDTIFSNDSSFCHVVDSLAQPLVNDNCGIAAIINSFNNTAFLNDTFPVDTNLITWTVTDFSGNTNSCSFNVIVLDTELPTIVCPADTAVGFCLDTLIYSLPVFADNCPGSFLALDSGIGSNNHFPIGFNTEYYSVIDAYGNAASCSFTVFVDTIPYLQLGPDTSICDYDEIVLSAGIPFNAGADSAFTYLWQDSSLAASFTANAFGTYYVTKTDSFGCVASDSIALGVFTSPTLPFFGDTSICIGDSITLRAGPDGNFTYLWSDSSSSVSFSTLPDSSGHFSVLKTDTNNCFNRDSVFVTVNPLPTPFLGNDTAICEGLVINFSVPQNFEGYLWSDSSNSFSIATDTAGSYSVTVTDINQCVNSDTILLDIYPAPTINFAISHDSLPIVNTDDSSRVCNGVVVQISVVDSFPIYFWSDGTSGRNISVNTSNNYNVLVFDSNNCNNNATYKVVVDTLPFVNLGADTAICLLDTISFDAGPNLLSYAWNVGPTSQAINVDSASLYVVVVTDSNNCINTDSIVLSIDTLPNVSLGGDTTICLRDQIAISPGTNYVSYQWSFFAPDTHTVNISTANSYWVNVTDANGCNANSDTLVLTNDTLPNIQLVPDQGICIGDSVFIDAGGGLASYTWNNAITTQSQTVNSTGTYIVNVVDSNQCIGTDTFNLVVYNLPVVNLGSNKRYCDGVGFNLQLTANQGPPYQSYLWSTAQTGQGITICNQPGGCVNVITQFPDTIWVRTTNINGCINTDTITIDIGANPPVTINVSDTSYCSDETKSIVLDAGPGFATYNWSNGESGQIILIDTAGNYTITIADVNGCQNTDNVVIREYPAPTINLPDDTAFCKNVSFNLNLNGGAGINYLYNWSTSQTTQNIVASTPGVYAVTVTTPEFCDSEAKINITEVPLPKATLEDDTLVCSGTFLELNVYNLGYTYLWNSGSLDSAILVDTSGLYSVRLRNKYCTIRDTAFVQYDYVPFVDLGPDSILCQGEVVVLDASFPNSNIKYIWQDGSNDTTFDANFAGEYSVLLSNRCGSFLDNINLFYEDCSNIYAPNTFSPNGDGENDFYRVYSDQDFTFFEIQIFNRMGEPVFQASSPDVSWDGVFNGSPSPIGAYTYYIRYSSTLDPNGGVYSQVGAVLLIR